MTRVIQFTNRDMIRFHLTDYDAYTRDNHGVTIQWAKTRAKETGIVHSFFPIHNIIAIADYAE